MNKKVFAITPEVSNAIERRFYIMKSYESLLAVLGVLMLRESLAALKPTNAASSQAAD